MDGGYLMLQEPDFWYDVFAEWYLQGSIPKDINSAVIFFLRKKGRDGKLYTDYRPVVSRNKVVAFYDRTINWMLKELLS